MVRGRRGAPPSPPEPPSPGAAARKKAAREEAKLHRACIKILLKRYPRANTLRGDGGQQLQGGVVAYRLARLEGRMAGAPDVVVMLKGVTGGPMQVEFKTPTGRLSAPQVKWHANQRAQGWKVHVVRYEHEFEAALDEHMGGVEPPYTHLPTGDTPPPSLRCSLKLTCSSLCCALAEYNKHQVIDLVSDDEDDEASEDEDDNLPATPAAAPAATPAAAAAPAIGSWAAILAEEHEGGQEGGQ